MEMYQQTWEGRPTLPQHLPLWFSVPLESSLIFAKLFPLSPHTLQGGTSRGYKMEPAPLTRLFQVRGTSTNNTKAFEVPPQATSLNLSLIHI